MSSHLHIALALALALGSAAALAQEPAPPAEELPKIEEIIVTAQRTAQNLQEVPIAIEAVTGDQLDNLSLRDLTEVQALTTGLNIFPASRSPVTTLRGVAYDPDSSAQTTVDFYWNDTPIESEGALRSMFDVGQIEVIKGPQATLRGGSAPSGAITVVTRRPDLEEIEGYFETQFSDNDQKLVQGAFGAPLIEGKLGVRIAGLYERNDGDAIRSGFVGSRQDTRTRGGRITLHAEPTDSFRATLIYQYLDVDDRGFDDVVTVGALQAGNPVTGPFSRRSVQETAPHYGNTLHYATLGLEYELAGHLISATGSYNKNERASDRDQDFGNAVANFAALQRVRTDFPFSFAEIRAESLDNERWNYMVGFDYRFADTFTQVDQADRSYFNFLAAFGIPGPFPTDGAIDFLAAAPPVGNPLPTCFAPPTFRPCNLIGYADQIIHIDIPVITREYAVFTRHSLQITEGTRLEGAIRYRDVESRRDSPATISLPQLFTNISANFVPPQFRKVPKHAWTGSLSLSHKFTEDLMAYFSYGHGFRLGSSSIVTNAFPPGSTAPFFGDETNEALELGFKAELFDGRARVNGAAFYQMFDGYQARVTNIAVDSDANGCFGPDYPYGNVALCPGPPSTGDGNDRFAPGLTYNAPATVRGFEIELDALLLEGWSVNLGVTWAKATFDKGASSPCNRLDANGDHVFTDPSGNAAGGFGVATCNRSGPLGNIPKFTLSAMSEYVLPIGSFEAYARTLIRYNGRHRQEALVVPRTFDGYGLVNLYAGVRHPEQGWDVTVWAKNLADREELIDISDPITYSVFPTGYSQLQVPRGREIGVTLRYDFAND